MPNNDLGTAHGRIRVDFDDRGSAAATAALLKMQQQFDQMNKNLEKIQKSLSDVDTNLGHTETELRRNTRAAKGFSSSLFDGHKSVARFASDVRDLNRDLTIAKFVIDKAKNSFDNFSGAVKFLNSVGSFDRADRRNIVRSISITMADLARQTNKTADTVGKFGQNVVGWYGQATKAVTGTARATRDSLAGTRSVFTLVTSGVILLRQKILGVKTAIDTAPQWTQKLLGVAKAVGLVGSAMGLLGKAIGPLKYIERFANTNLFRNAMGDAQKFAGILERVGNKTKGIFGVDITKGLVAGLKNSEQATVRFMERASVSSMVFSQSLENISESVGNFVKDFKSVMTGIALFTNGIKNLWGRLAWFFKLPKPVLATLAIMISRILPTALHYLNKALVGTSNFIAGLLDGIIQLGRGFVALPGMIAMFGAAATSIMGVFKGLGKQLKDLFDEDPIKALEAYWKLPDHLKPLGKALQELVPKWKDLQKTLQTRAFANVEDDIRKLSQTYFPIFERGALGVITAFRNIKDELVSFAMNRGTQTDISGFYDQTAGAIRNVAAATQPAAQGLRDMAAIGAIFVRSMSGFLPVLTNQFAQWAATNRQNGNFMRWMYDAAAGVYDLIRGMKQLSQATFSVLTMFSTNTGGDFLERFANSMQKLNNRVKESELSGWIYKIRHGVQNMGEKKIEDLKATFHTLGRAIQNTYPFVEKLSNVFSKVFVWNMNRAIWVIEHFIMLINELGLDKAIGWVLGFAGSFKMLPKIWAAVGDSFKVFAGIFLIMRDRGKVVSWLEDKFLAFGSKLETLGPLGGKAAKGLGNITDAVSRGIGGLATFVSALAGVGTAALVLFAVWQNGRDRAKAFDDQIKANSEHLVDFKKNLQDAFTDDGSLTGRSVMDTIRQEVQTMVTDLNDTIEKAPNFGDQLYDLLFRNSNSKNSSMGANESIWQNPFKNSDYLNDAQDMGEKAAQAAAGLKTLREAGIDLANVVAMSDVDFKNFIENQKKLGVEGEQAANVLTKQREVYISIKDDMKRAGPAAVQLSAGIEKIAEAGGDATSKLDGLKQILEALGILKTSALDAAAAYEQGLADIVTKIDEIAQAAGGLDRSVLMTGDSFNLTTQAGRDFYQQMRQLGDEFMANVSAGHDAAAEYKKFEERLQAIATQTGLSIEEIKKLATAVGMSPEFVGISMSLVGKDKFTQDLFAFLAQAQVQASDGVNAPIEFRVQDDPKALVDKINAAVGAAVASVSGTNVKIGADLTPDQIAKVQKMLSERLGVQVPGMPAPLVPPKISPVIEPPKSLPGILPGGHGAAGTPPAEPLPAPASSQPLDDQVTKANKEVEDLKNKIAELEDKEVIIKVTIEGKDQFDDFYNKLNEIVTKLGNIFNDLNTTITTALGAAYIAIDEFLKTSTGRMDQETDNVYNSGKAFVDAFARGIRDNPAAYTEINTLLTKIKGNLHNSPPKWGPLAAHGDAARFGGTMFVQSYADGLRAGTPAAASAVGGMGNAVLGGLPQGRGVEQAGQYLGQLSQITTLMQNAITAFSNISQSLLNFGKYISDPQGKGTFFGKRMGWKRDPSISDADLLKKRQDEAQQRVSSMLSSPNRNDQNYDPLTGYPKITTPGLLDRNASKADIQRAVAAAGQAAGASKEDIAAAFAVIDQESGYNATIVGKGLGGGGADAIGLFQQTLGMWGTMDQLTNPNVAIQKYWDAWKQAGGANAAERAVNTQRPSGYNAGTISGRMAQGTLKEAIDLINSPAMISAVDGMVAGGAYRNILHDTEGVRSGVAARIAAAEVARAFPQIQEIGGGRLSGTAKGTHDVGKAIDIAIPNWETPAGKALGDQINDFLRVNAQALGIRYTIWRDIGKNIDNGSTFNVPGHQNHIDVQFNDGGTATVGPNGTTLKYPTGTPGLIPQSAYGPPVDPNNPPSPPPIPMVMGPDGKLIPAPDTHGTGNGQPPGPIDGLTGQPWTQDRIDWYNQQFPNQYDASNLQPGDLTMPGIVQQTQEQMLDQLKLQTPLLQQSLDTMKDTNASDQAVMDAMTFVQSQRDALMQTDSPVNRMLAQQLDSAVSDAASSRGLVENQNPFDTALSYLSAATGIASDIFGVIQSGIETAGAAKELADMAVRGPQNTEDIYNAVDKVQKFIELGSQVATAVGDIVSTVGSFTAGQDYGATAAIGAVTQLAGGIMQAVNAYIDLGQEVYRIAGTYVGDFLGYLTGGLGGALEGNVKFLLDQQTNQLMTYSADNPMDKRNHNLPFQQANPNARNQMIGNINVYGGPGSDPRDNTRQMMFQVKQAQMQQAISG